MIRVDPSWQELLARLEGDPSWRKIFVLGPMDAGKTTLCRFLGAQLAQFLRVAAVDCDPGQSALGLPASLALAWEPWAGGRPLARRFVGATSPAGHFLPMLTGIGRLAECAFEEGAERVVFDSSGYMATGAGREFHFQVLDLLAPDHLVALQREDELEPLLANFARCARPELHRLPISGTVVHRDRFERRSYRWERFRDYFADAVSQTLPLDGIGFHGRVPAGGDQTGCRKRLIALCDGRGFAAVVGIVEELDIDRACLRILAPPFEREQIASVQFGSISLDRCGREL